MPACTKTIISADVFDDLSACTKTIISAHVFDDLMKVYDMYLLCGYYVWLMIRRNKLQVLCKVLKNHEQH